ncbi:HAMP domain-containing histidine kinase [Clostridium sp. 19966]|uniref:sensor histidine kinase n=1 Tax=Clostridium sp. 19966 TaxID=2768166 RepID=UPI0028E00893|nr:HAMP domain-containing sensor histidine kinase [Clostridium sp. 19966]MDT8718956.1 HAMP domain-containing histidine kinase [Clostridium sp. 19966]
MANRNKWLVNNFKGKFTQRKRLREEEHRLHMEYHMKMNKLYGDHRGFERYKKHIRYTRPLIVIINACIWLLIFHFWGIKIISIILALMMTIGGIFEFIFLINLEKSVFKPISLLKEGVEELTRGNYAVEVNCYADNEIAILINSFNEMAKKLKEAEEIKTQYEENRKALIANISHDLKTPITSIQGYIETMADRTDIPQETINKYHQIIYTNATYMNKLIDDLFLFSKLDMQKLDFNFENVNMKAFMNDLMEEFQFELEDRGISFNYKDQLHEEIKVKLDMKRINQIFRNIVGNAVKHGTEKNIKIEVKMYKLEDMINIDIKDNGHGIPKDKLPYIFDRFYRIDSERTKNLISTGLGLAIAKELIEAHKGKISAVSEENVGSCFTIKLPILK